MICLKKRAGRLNTAGDEAGGKNESSHGVTEAQRVKRKNLFTDMHGKTRIKRKNSHGDTETQRVKRKELFTDMHGKTRIKNKGRFMIMTLKIIKIREYPCESVSKYNCNKLN